MVNDQPTASGDGGAAVGNGSAAHDLIVIGGSAGSLQSLLSIVAGLPANFPAAVLIVMHTAPYGPSRLPQILSRSGPLPASAARHGEAITPGQIMVARPDYHLLVRPGRLELSHGPRENHTRPAVDPLFRTAARAYGSRVIGVILSGALYDGAAGLLAIKVRGGVAVVQDPEEASFDGMPRTALQFVDADYVLPAAEIAATLTALAARRREGEVALMTTSEPERPRVIQEDLTEQGHNQRHNQLTPYTCPDCGGSLWQIEDGPIQRFHCHVGHIWSPEILMGHKAEQLEGALWACVRLLTEKATLSRQLAERTKLGGEPSRAARIAEQAELDESRAAIIRELLEGVLSPGGPIARQPGLIDNGDS
jgi:two-component system, chemotaxis family, protein-glutamate methylesterase/glutaminase